MTEAEKKLEMEKYLAKLKEIKKHRKPCSKDDEVSVDSASIQQGKRELGEGIKVLNSKKATMPSLEIPIKAKPGGYKEIKNSKKQNGHGLVH